MYLVTTVLVTGVKCFVQNKKGNGRQNYIPHRPSLYHFTLLLSHSDVFCDRSGDGVPLESPFVSEQGSRGRGGVGVYVWGGKGRGEGGYVEQD